MREFGRHDLAAGVVQVSAVARGLQVSVEATESRTSGAVHIVVTATTAHARGAFGYDIAFGDSTSAHNIVPQFCMAGPGVPRHGRWAFAHHYARGTYRIRVSVHVNCTSEITMARLTVHAA